MNETNVHALTGAYVLDALDETERSAFEAHLPTCPDCAAEVASLREAVVRMAAAEATAPPAELRDAVREQIRRTPQLPPVVPTATRPAAQAPGSASEPTSAQHPSHRSAARRRAAARWTSWPVTAAAASVAVLLAFGGTLLVQAQRDNRAAEQVQAQVMRIMAAPDMVSYDLGLGVSHLVLSEDMHSAAVMCSDLPDPRTGMVYQVWMMHSDGSMDAGPTFMPKDGDVTAVIEGELSDVAAFMVTEEPPGGSQTPTGDYLAELHL